MSPLHLHVARSTLGTLALAIAAVTPVSVLVFSTAETILADGPFIFAFVRRTPNHVLQAAPDSVSDYSQEVHGVSTPPVRRA